MHRIEKEITEYLRNYSKDKVLDLKHYEMGVEGTKYLAQKLKDIDVENVKLDLAYNNIGDEGTKYIANGLKGSHVKYINLKYNNIGDDGAEHIANVLKDSQVEDLHMQSNRIGPVGAAAFSKGLKDSHVQTLNLGYNAIGDEGAELIASVLKHSIVQILNLKDNDIGPDGAKFLANGLKDSRVQNLNLEENCIFDKGALHIFNIIADTCVQSVNILDNGITEEGTKCIANAIKDTQVTDIIVNPMFLGWEISHVLQNNKHNFNKICDGFNFLVSKDAKEGPLVFQVHTTKEADEFIDVEEYLSFVKILHDKPSLAHHIGINSNIVSAKHEIVQFVENISIQFCEFISNVMGDDHSRYVNLLKICEDMHLDYIVKDLLLNRGACTIEPNGDVLYPYVYILLHQYKQPVIGNGPAFKCNKREIIRYFQDHLELGYAQEAIELLENVNEYKRKRIL